MYARFLRYPEDESYSEIGNNLDKFKLRYNSPFKPRAPTPPKSRESSPKASVQLKTMHLRHSSVDSGDVFVLKVPFTSVSSVNHYRKIPNPTNPRLKRRHYNIKPAVSKKNRRSGSLEPSGYY